MLVRVGGVAAAVVAVDQLTKTLALEALSDGGIPLFWTLRLHLAFNSGIAFSQGEGLTGLITVAGLLLVVALVVFARRVERPVMAVALGLVIGGACGNLSDRLFRDHGGAVIDFIDLKWWPVFNFDDGAISCGAALLVLATLREPTAAPQQ